MKKTNLLMVFVFTIIRLSTTAQTTFQKTFGGTGDEEGNSVQQTTDGGYVLLGTTTSFGAGGEDVYLVKTNANGDTLWTKTYGGTSDDNGNSVQQTTDGGYIIAGSTNSFGSGQSDVYLIKTNSFGDTIWTRTYGGTSSESANSVQQTTDGGYIVTGDVMSFGAGFPDVYLIKTNGIGNVLWTKTFGFASDDDFGFSVQQTSDSGFIVSGYTKTYSQLYLIKTNSIGDSLWTEILNPGGEGHAVKQTTDGGYIIAGDDNYLGTEEVYLIKTNSGGDTLWTKTFGVADEDGGRSVQITTDGGYIITGYTVDSTNGFTDVYLIKTDSIGNASWTKSFGGLSDDEIGNSVQQTTDGGFIVLGNSLSLGSGGSDMYLIKTNANGSSGCNQNNPATNTHSPAIQVTRPPTIVSSGGIASSTGTLLGHGSDVIVLCTSVGVEEVELDSYFTISPNPSLGNFIISIGGAIMKGNVDIFNILGKNIYAENISNEAIKEINLKNVSDGIYFVKVFDGEKYYCKKIIVEHN